MNGAPSLGNVNSNSHSSSKQMEWITLIENGNIIDAGKRDSNERDPETVETSKVLPLLQYEKNMKNEKYWKLFILFVYLFCDSCEGHQFKNYGMGYIE